MDLQKLMDAMNNAGRIERAHYHLTLGKMIKVLEGAGHGMSVVLDTGEAPGQPLSYRGYYSDLSFEPTDTPINVGTFLEVCRGALGATFEGYKGGDFVMDERTPLWVAPYGCCGRAIMGASVEAGGVILATKDLDD